MQYSCTQTVAPIWTPEYALFEEAETAAIIDKAIKETNKPMLQSTALEIFRRVIGP